MIVNVAFRADSDYDVDFTGILSFDSRNLEIRG